MKTSRIGSFVRTYFGVLAAISLLAIIQTQLQTQALLKLRTRYKWVLLMAFFAFNFAVGVYIAVRGSTRPVRWNVPSLLPQNRPIALLVGLTLFLLPVPIFLFARQDFFGRGLEAFFRLLWLFWWLALIQAAGLRMAFSWEWERAMTTALLANGAGAWLYTLGVGVSVYPFSIGWSEASRYYYGSLVFSRTLYGERLPLSVMHGTRYVLQSLPFLAGAGFLWVARLWQVCLWIGLTGAAAWALVRRLGWRQPAVLTLAATWLCLFFFQGAVYYHLQVCVILILLGVSVRHSGRSLAFVALASFWAGMSRVNWFPVPAMLGIALYLLEKPYDSADTPWKYVRMPVLWGLIGVLSALAGQAAYVALSGNTNLEAFASSFSSDLLWYRWLPSATNPIGIIPGVIIVSAPVLALVAWRLQAEPRRIHWLRLTGLGALLLVLLAGGLVVSTKIGGGGDLHNMDAYLVLLACLGAYSLKGSIQLDAGSEPERSRAPWSLVALGVLVPVAFALLRLGGRFDYDPVQAKADLNVLSQEVDRYGKTGEVLFMYERHLQTFDMVPRVPMVPEYEVVTLMEMAISGNQAYLSQFYSDLQRHRFAAIIAHPQNLGVETGDFIEENDAWNRWIAQPLLCQYKPAITLDYSNVQILVPRERSCSDFPPSFAEK